MKLLVCMFLSVFMIFGFSLSSAAEEISISASAAVVIAGDTNDVIFEINKDIPLPMASTTKIMTALLLAEQKDLTITVTVTKEMVSVEGSSMGLLPGDTVSYEALLYGMLLASGNDAANVTAHILGGNIDGFAELMNKKAKSLGLKNTNFVTPSGLDDDEHYTTAYDLALLASAALKNPVFKAVCSSKTATVYYGNPPYRRTLKNHNKLLSVYDGLVGVKTGFTKKSGRCLVTAAERDGTLIVAVTLNDPDDWNDHKKMLDYGFENIKKVSFSSENIPDSIPVIAGDCDRVKISVPDAEFVLSSKNNNKMTAKILLPEFVYSGISAGKSVGRVEYYLENKLIKSENIISLADVLIADKKPKKIKKIKEKFKLLIGLII